MSAWKGGNNVIASRPMVKQRILCKSIRVILTIALMIGLASCELFPWLGQERTIDALTEVTDSEGNVYRVGHDQVTSIR